MGTGFGVSAITATFLRVANAYDEFDRIGLLVDTVKPLDVRRQIHRDSSHILFNIMIDHYTITQKLDYIGLNCRKELSAVLRMDIG